MVAPVNQEIAASAGVLKKIAVVVFAGLIALAYQAIKPPPTKICGSADGPPVTDTRVKLRDGRHLAYKINGVTDDKAKYKIVDIHGFDMCKFDYAIQHVSQDFVERLGIQIIVIDRPGYGESDPDPNRTEKSLALDIEELADELDLGSKFYVLGYSMGGEGVWACLHYIPHRLAGAGLIAPKINYWWPSFPAKLAKEGFRQQITQDQWTLRVAHYIPWLTPWWNTQKYFPHFGLLWNTLAIFSPTDIQTFPRLAFRIQHAAVRRQQGDYMSVHKDLMNGYGNRDLDPTGIKNPFPNGEGSVHMWHGDEDKIVPVILQRYIAEKLPWVQYHEVAGVGHIFPYAEGMPEMMLTTLLEK
jgi:pimeloyl-ACP methyl ester carboxylesterase